MSTMAMVGVIALSVICICGIIIKIYTKRRLRDIDGLDTVIIVKESEVSKIVNGRTYLGQ